MSKAFSEGSLKCAPFMGTQLRYRAHLLSANIPLQPPTLFLPRSVTRVSLFLVCFGTGSGTHTLSLKRRETLLVPYFGGSYLCRTAYMFYGPKEDVTLLRTPYSIGRSTTCGVFQTACSKTRVVTLTTVRE